MGVEVRTAYKALPTHRAFKGSYSCLDALVTNELVTAVEALPTLSTCRVSLLMDVLVHLRF